MQNFFIRVAKLILGLMIYSLALVLGIKANIGLSPWDAFGVGVSGVTGISYGIVSIYSGIVILITVVLIFKEKIGLGTILNTILIGVFADIILALNIIPVMTKFSLGILLLIISQFLICIATYFYIGTGFGSGPRDTLMVALGKKFANTPIGVIRGTIEGTVLLIGWALGAKVGLGTVISVFGIGFIMQFTFKFLKFNIRAVVHENIIETINNIKNLFINKEEDFNKAERQDI